MLWLMPTAILLASVVPLTALLLRLKGEVARTTEELRRCAALRPVLAEIGRDARTLQVEARRRIG